MRPEANPASTPRDASSSSVLIQPANHRRTSCAIWDPGVSPVPVERRGLAPTAHPGWGPYRCTSAPSTDGDGGYLLRQGCSRATTARNFDGRRRTARANMATRDGGLERHSLEQATPSSTGTVAGRFRGARAEF